MQDQRADDVAVQEQQLATTTITPAATADASATTAVAPPPPPPHAATPHSSPALSHAPHHARDLLESIRGLHELHQQGGLTSEEFAQAKQMLLDSRAASLAAVAAATSSSLSSPSSSRKASRHSHRGSPRRRHRRKHRRGSRHHKRHHHDDDSDADDDDDDGDRPRRHRVGAIAMHTGNAASSTRSGDGGGVDGDDSKQQQQHDVVAAADGSSHNLPFTAATVAAAAAGGGSGSTSSPNYYHQQAVLAQRRTPRYRGRRHRRHRRGVPHRRPRDSRGSGDDSDGGGGGGGSEKHSNTAATTAGNAAAAAVVGSEGKGSPVSRGGRYSRSSLSSRSSRSTSISSSSSTSSSSSSSTSSSSSSSSSSGSSVNQFIVVPRAKLWRPLHTHAAGGLGNNSLLTASATTTAAPPYAGASHAGGASMLSYRNVRRRLGGGGGGAATAAHVDKSSSVAGILGAEMLDNNNNNNSGGGGGARVTVAADDAAAHGDADTYTLYTRCRARDTEKTPLLEHHLTPAATAATALHLGSDDVVVDEAAGAASAVLVSGTQPTHMSAAAAMAAQQQQQQQQSQQVTPTTGADEAAAAGGGGGVPAAVTTTATSSQSSRRPPSGGGGMPPPVRSMSDLRMGVDSKELRERNAKLSAHWHAWGAAQAAAAAGGGGAGGSGGSAAGGATSYGTVAGTPAAHGTAAAAAATAAAAAATSTAASVSALLQLEPRDVVRVHYYNSRGGSSVVSFDEVLLQESEMRPPRYLHKGRASTFYYVPEAKSALYDGAAARMASGPRTRMQQQQQQQQQRRRRRTTHTPRAHDSFSSRHSMTVRALEQQQQQQQQQAATTTEAPPLAASASTVTGQVVSDTATTHEDKAQSKATMDEKDEAQWTQADKVRDGDCGAKRGGGNDGDDDEVPGVLSAEEQQMWNEISVRSMSERSSNSYLEQSLNWYWIDVTGRDASRREYDAVLAALTQRFNLCTSFLADRDHSLVLPQLYASPHHPGQYMLNLRVATLKISIADDSVVELTNRWIVVVDLQQHLVITLHRVDTESMALLRTHWRTVMQSNEVFFQEFLLKIIDDAICTYQLSLDVHEDLLDKCESKLFAYDRKRHVVDETTHLEDLRILNYFEDGSRSAFLRRLLDLTDTATEDKSEMNSFLHHLHRRTSVQHRMLNLTQAVLTEAFTKLQLCSKELANQMSGLCIELGDRALEVREQSKTLLDLHISLQSFRTNELMAVLTRVSVLFTPCTFLAGVYGMNFHYNFPELTWKYGYPFFWLLCLVLVVIIRYIFLRT